MARALIVGCGCRGRALASELLASGWQVRGTSRDPVRRGLIADAGIEAAAADPAAPGTVLELVGDVAVIVWLLGDASGEATDLDRIHGEALAALLERLVDTPVRAIAYERRGSAGEGRLARGAAILGEASARWRLRAQLIDAGGRDGKAWLGAARSAVEASLRPG